MIEIDEQKRSEMRDSILSLAMACPIDRCSAQDCPLFHIRQLDLPGRLEWFKSLTDEDLVYLNTYHCICMKTKAELHAAELCN